MSDIETWVKIGKKNPWIKGAYDPPFNESSFHECKTIDELCQKFEHGNWCLGQAFYIGDICFINQIDGRDEWLTIKDDLPFESISCELVIRKYGRQEIENYINRFNSATKEQLQKLEY